MPVFTVNQFDRAIVAQMSSVALPTQYQLLQVRLRSENVKFITGIECGWTMGDQAAAATDILQLARQFIRGRLIINLEDVDYSGFSSAQLFIAFSPLNPFYTTVTTLPLPQTIPLDQIIINNAFIEFTKPIKVEEGIPVNILLGMGFIDGDTALTPSGKVGYLNVHGYYERTVTGNRLTDEITLR